MSHWTFDNATSLSIHQGDITTLAVDAIVNAANSRLAGGGGVDGAIHRAAGVRELQTACQNIIKEIESLPPGQVVVTTGFNLPAKCIIHTVGPIWSGGDKNEPELLAACYRHSLEMAKAIDAETIAFPAISCGVYGYPEKEAALIALRELEAGLKAGHVKHAIMVLHSDEMFTAWRSIADALFEGDAR